MANMIKYGRYWIAAGIAVTGVLWFNRPGDPRIMGEDIADFTEDAMDKYIVPYLTDTNLPDYYGAYGNLTGDGTDKSNSVSIRIAYDDIINLAGITRLTALNKYANNILYVDRIYWTTNSIIGDTYEPATMQGSFNTAYSTNAYGVITERFSYDTNTCLDVLLTTETRSFEPYRELAYIRYPLTIGSFPEPITATNYPVGSRVFPENTTVGIKDISSYYFWPFAEPFMFPWEQWSWRNSSRVALLNKASYNLTWTNVCWIGTNSLSLAFGASSAVTNHAGYAIGSFYDLRGNMSVPMAYVSQPATNAIFLYIPGGSSGYETDIARNITWAASWLSKVAIRKTGLAEGEVITASFIGDKLTVSTIAESTGGKLLIISAESPDRTNTLSVIKFSVPSQPTISPIYVAISVCDGTPIKTNAYFTVSNDLATTNSPTGTATTNSLAWGNLDPSFYGDAAYPTDDKRITTNKLYELREVLTNLYRTVFFGDAGSLVSSNAIMTTYTNGNNSMFSTNYTGETLPVVYYDFGIGDSFIAGLLSGAAVESVETNQANVSTMFSEVLNYDANKSAFYNENDGNPYWESDTWIDGLYYRYEYEYKDVRLKYPSLYAVTNGLVSAVTVYALFENAFEALDQPGYRGKESDTNVTFDISGEYWTTASLSNSLSGITINIPTSEPPVERTVGTSRVYGDAYPNQDRFRSKAVYQKIYSATNPTSEIVFDIVKPTAIGVDFSRKYAYNYDKGIDPDLYYENETWDYSLTYEVRVPKFMIVVDWSFKHLGRGFEPQTNSPAWR